MTNQNENSRRTPGEDPTIQTPPPEATNYEHGHVPGERSTMPGAGEVRAGHEQNASLNERPRDTQRSSRPGTTISGPAAAPSGSADAQLFTVSPEMSIEECIRQMEAHRVRRAPVVDEAGRCVGMIAQADIAQRAQPHQAAEMVREISQPPGYQGSYH